MSKTDNEEVKKIKKTIKTFIDGISNNDYKEIYAVFHPEAQSIGFNSTTGDISIVTRDHWKEMFENNQPDPDVTFDAEIEFIKTVGKAAIAQVKIIEEVPESRKIFYDFYSLIKIDEEWIIVNKTFHREVESKKYNFSEISIDDVIK